MSDEIRIRQCNCRATCVKFSVQSCQPSSSKLFQLNPDWSLLKLRWAESPKWKHVFAARQISLRKNVIEGLLLPSVLSDIVCDYAIRTWFDFESGDLINVKHVETDMWSAAVVAIVGEHSVFVHFLGMHPSWNTHIWKYQWPQRISQFDFSENRVLTQRPNCIKIRQWLVDHGLERLN